MMCGGGCVVMGCPNHGQCQRQSRVESMFVWYVLPSSTWSSPVHRTPSPSAHPLASWGDTTLQQKRLFAIARVTSASAGTMPGV